MPTLVTKVLWVKGYLTPLTSKDIKYINKIGVEFEGAWDTKPENIHVDESIQNLHAPKDTDDDLTATDHNCHSCVLHDFKTAICKANEEACRNSGHNHCNDNCLDENHCDHACEKSCGCSADGFHVGECISPPCTIEELRSWVAQYSPDTVNKSCGLHVHVSMKRQLDYNRLMDKEFTDFFVDYFKNWGEDMGLSKSHSFWERLEGRNRYCKKEHKANEQAAQTVKNAGGEPGKIIRRCQLNFCYNIRNEDGSPRSTLECRVFPAFKDSAYIMSAIENFIRCVEQYLSETESKKEVFKLRGCEAFYEQGSIIEQEIGEMF